MSRPGEAAWVLLGCLLFTVVCRAAEPLAPRRGHGESAAALLEEGKLRYTLGEFERSIQLLTEAHALLTSARRPGEEQPSRDVMIPVLTYLGLDHAVLGDGERAAHYFEQLLLADPEAKLDPARTKRAVVELFATVRARLRGTLEISSRRPGDTVLVDGAERGKTPLTLELTVGRYQLVVRDPSRTAEYSTSTVVRHRQATVVQATLRPRLTTLAISSIPVGATVELDGRPLGTTPLRTTKVAPGRHRLIVSLERYTPARRELTLLAGQAVRHAVTLWPAPAARPGLWQRKRVWTWVAAGTAVAAAGAGVGLGVWTQDGFDAYQAAGTSGDRELYYRLRSELPDRVTGTNIAFAMAGTFAATAILLFFVEGR